MSIISTAYNLPCDSKSFERIPAPLRYLTSLKAAEKERERKCTSLPNRMSDPDVGEMSQF